MNQSRHHPCPECGRGFKNGGNLTYHIRTHHPESLAAPKKIKPPAEPEILGRSLQCRFLFPDHQCGCTFRSERARSYHENWFHGPKLGEERAA